jgi:hypothetical protein
MLTEELDTLYSDYDEFVDEDGTVFNYQGA